MKTVGIIGGMGPEATVLLMQRLLRAVNAADDGDHIPLIVHQNPQVPSRIRRLIDGAGDDPGPVLAQMACDLQSAGAQALAMPCNTAHSYVPQITAATALPFLDMRSATVAQLPQGRIGMLASPALQLTGAYDAHFAAAGVTAVWPNDNAPVLNLIRRVKAGDSGPDAGDDLRRIADDMAQHADHLLIACTELSLLTGGLSASGWTDTLDCLVAAIAAFSTGAPAHSVAKAD